MKFDGFVLMFLIQKVMAIISRDRNYVPNGKEVRDFLALVTGKEAERAIGREINPRAKNLLSLVGDAAEVVLPNNDATVILETEDD